MINTFPKIAINRNWALGDVLMATPIVKKLFQDRKGNCSIDFFTHGFAASILNNNPYINQVRTTEFNESIFKDYDIIINLDLSYEKNPNMHIVDAYGLSAFGTSSFDKSLDLFTTVQDQHKAQDFKNELNENFIVFHIRNADSPCRNIPLNIWQPMINFILANSNLKLVFVGTESDSYFLGNPRLIDARGKFSLHELKEVMNLSKVFVGPDSGPAIVASSTKTNMVVLYTDVHQEFRRPYRPHGRYMPFEANIECQGCRATLPIPVVRDFCKRGDIECINRFDPIEIATSILKLSE